MTLMDYCMQYIGEIMDGKRAAPEGVTGKELEMLYDRFANGDDFSFVEKEWEPLMAVEYRHRHNVMWFIFLFIALVIAAMAAYQHGWIE